MAVRIELFYVRVLCRTFYRMLDCLTETNSNCYLYQTVVSSFELLVQQRFEMSQNSVRKATEILYQVRL